MTLLAGVYNREFHMTPPEPGLNKRPSQADVRRIPPTRRTTNALQTGAGELVATQGAAAALIKCEGEVKGQRSQASTCCQSGDEDPSEIMQLFHSPFISVLSLAAGARERVAPGGTIASSRSAAEIYEPLSDTRRATSRDSADAKHDISPEGCWEKRGLFCLGRSPSVKRSGSWR